MWKIPKTFKCMFSSKDAKKFSKHKSIISPYNSTSATGVKPPPPTGNMHVSLSWVELHVSLKIMKQTKKLNSNSCCDSFFIAIFA